LKALRAGNQPLFLPIAVDFPSPGLGCDGKLDRQLQINCRAFQYHGMFIESFYESPSFHTQK
jgi:hypothetical protein